MKRYIIYGFLLISFCLYAQDDFDPEAIIQNGILGDYTLKESFEWWDQNAGKNFFRDEINISFVAKDFEKAQSDINAFDEDISDMAAVFYICPENSDTIKLSGYLEYDDGWIADMNMIVPRTMLPTLKKLPPNTLVFAVDESSIVWGILKFFYYGDEEDFQITIDGKEMTAFRYGSGKIAYEYRVTPEEEELIGVEAYFTPPAEREAILNLYKKEKRTIQNCASKDTQFSGPVKSVKEISYEVIATNGKMSKGEKMIEVNYFFDRMGNLIEETKITKDYNVKTVYKYDDTSTFVEGQGRDRDGRVIVDIKPDENGNCIETTYDNEKVIKLISNYNTLGEKVTKAYMDGELFSTSIFTYDEYGNVKKTFISVPSLQREGAFDTRHVYDDEGRVLEQDGVFKVYYKYDIDNYDNWIISNTYQDGKPQMITERKFEYY